ncbi:MAG: energy transducer TonB [Rikenellaceae bacterium]
MELKKTPKADLSNKRSLLLEIGLIVALAVVIAAFAYTPKEHRIEKVEMNIAVVEEQIIEITRQDLKPPAPPKKVEIKVISQLLEVVTNDTTIEDEIDFTEFDEETAVLDNIEGSDEAIEDDQPFLIAETMPSFQGGGLDKFHKWVQTNVRYPQIAQENGISGRVTLTFVVEKNGTVSNIQVLQSPDSSLAEEAVRVLSKSPTWTPGKQRNQTVRVRFTLPVVFSLSN